MITEDYVSFETAKLLKEKGFDDNCASLYDLRNGEFSQRGVGYIFNNGQWDNFITAPTLQMVMKWLREVHNLEIYPYHVMFQENNKWWYEIEKVTKGCSNCQYEEEPIYSTYEEACESAIKYCLENLI